MRSAEEGGAPDPVPDREACPTPFGRGAGATSSAVRQRVSRSTLAGRLRDGAAGIAARPRHAALFGLAGGLALGPVAPGPLWLAAFALAALASAGAAVRAAQADATPHAGATAAPSERPTPAHPPPRLDSPLTSAAQPAVATDGSPQRPDPRPAGAVRSAPVSAGRGDALPPPRRPDPRSSGAVRSAPASAGRGRALPRVRLRACAALLAAGLLAGSLAGTARTRALDYTTLLARTHGLAVGTATLLQPPRRSKFGGWSASARFAGEPVLLRVRADADLLPDVGTLLQVDGTLTAPDPYATSRGAHADLRTDAATPDGRRGGVEGWVDGVRRRAELALDRGLPPGAAGLLQGMVLGQDAALPDDVRTDFRAASLSHLVAASGTNVVLLAALGAGLAAALGLGLSGRLVVVLGLIVLYVPLAGGGPSILRAGVMGAAIAVAGLLGRPAARWYGLELAAVVTLAADPHAAADPGWQLSFAAVVGIALLATGWRERLEHLGLARTPAEVLAVTAAATVSTAPIVAAHFGQSSLWAIPANVLAAPVVAPIMWLGVCSAALGQLALSSPACSLLDGVAGLGTGYLVWLAHLTAHLPGAGSKVGPAPVLMTATAALALTRSPRARRAFPVGALAAALAGVGLRDAPAAVPPPGPGVLRVTLLDIGQGDATLLEQGGGTVLVDAGPPDDGVVTDLRRQGVRRLDLLVITHADADHVGSAAAILEAMPVGLVLDGIDGVENADATAAEAAAAARRVALLRPSAGQLLHVPGGLALHVLWPHPEAPAAHLGEPTNDRAIVMEADGATGGRVLLTADAESDVLDSLPLRSVDVLKVSHHGSADPGLPGLLQRLRPRIAGIEVGAHNSYGHPAPSTLQALGAVPTVLRTDRNGDVRLDRTPDGRWLIRTGR